MKDEGGRMKEVFRLHPSALILPKKVPHHVSSLRLPPSSFILADLHIPIERGMIPTQEETEGAAMIHVSEQSTALLQALESAAQAVDRQAFIAQAEAIDWSAQMPDDLAHAIDLALHLELGTLAIALAQQGVRLFPDHERLQQAAHILAPPVIRTTPAAPVQGIEASRTWIRDHADTYRGQWVAVREGTLLGTASSLKGLLAALGPDQDRTNTIVTRVL
jgi:hypothetical protein